jgi:hypothetical protein
MQIFGKDGIEIDEDSEDFSACTKLKLIEQLGCGGQGEVFRG